SQYSQSFLSLPCFLIRLSQQGKKPRLEYLCPCGLQGGHPLTHLRNPLLPTSLLGYRPAPQDSSPRQLLCKPMLGRKDHGGFCPLLDCWCLLAELMEPGRTEEGMNQAVRM